MKPPNAGKGRTKGVPNKTTRAFKEAVLAAFNDERLGGTDGLAEWATKNRTEFYKICGRLIPHEVIGPGKDGEHLVKTIIHEHRRSE